ncbi:MAG: ribulose-phosphate 3-epimerase [Firmicutes bacterium]|nr:ribulose-phosphate 3-epimerase [Bacillota bacterium]
MKISASILSCDFSNIGKEIKKVSDANVDSIHFDVMDGHFVPNISFGPEIIKSARKYSNLPFEVHLMVSNPIEFVESITKVGGDIIIFHFESNSDVLCTIDKVRKNKKKIGISVKPKTCIESIIPFLDLIDLVLIMTVEPGFGGQTFLKDQIKKILKLKEIITKKNLDVDIEVDGGININTAEICSKSGVDICVAGTYIFESKNIDYAVSYFKTIE